MGEDGAPFQWYIVAGPPPPPKLLLLVYPLEKILMAGQWSTSSNFYTFYRKDIVVTGRLPGPQFASGFLTQNAT